MKNLRLKIISFEMNWGIKIGRSPKVVFAMQCALYFITLLPFMVVDLVFHQQVYNY